jgi:phosphoserine phosphatase RsbU/P
MSKEKKLIEVQYELTMDSIKPLREHVCKILKKFNIDSQRIMEVGLAINEWLTNLMKHPASPACEVIVILSVFDNDFYMLKLKDKAEPFVKFDYYIHELEKDSPEIGHGIFVLREYFEFATYSIKRPGFYDFNQLCLPISQTSSMHLNKPRIAFISDDNVLTVYLSFLLRAKYHLDVMTTGSELLDNLKSIDYEVILVDSILPDYDSDNLRDLLAHNKQYSLIPFVYLLNTEKQLAELRTAILPIDEFIIRPLRKEHLIKIVKRVIKRTRKQSQKENYFDSKHELVINQLPKHCGNFNVNQWTLLKSDDCSNFLLKSHRANHDYIILGDVISQSKNKNVYASIYAGFIKAAIATLIESNPIEHVLEKLSSLLFNDDALEKVIATVLLIDLDHEDNVIHIINAGHAHPLVISEHEVRQSHIQGDLLGLAEMTHYQIESIKLKKNEHHVNNLKKLLQKNATLNLNDQVLQLKSTFEDLIHYQDWKDTTIVMIEKA